MSTLSGKYSLLPAMFARSRPTSRSQLEGRICIEYIDLMFGKAVLFASFMSTFFAGIAHNRMHGVPDIMPGHAIPGLERGFVNPSTHHGFEH